MWELDYKESWVLKNWCFWTVVLEKTLECSLDCKEIQSVHLKGNQSWIFTGRTDVEAETRILWLPDVKRWLIWKDPDAGKDWGQEERGSTEAEMVGWHHQLNGHEFKLTPEVDDGQGGLACCSPWDRKESDRAEQLNWTELKIATREATRRKPRSLANTSCHLWSSNNSNCHLTENTWGSQGDWQKNHPPSHKILRNNKWLFKIL